MKIEKAKAEDLLLIENIDSEITHAVFRQKIRNEEILLGREQNRIIAYLRYSLFWDKIPFLNLLFVEEIERHKGFGAYLVKHWEEGMKEKGFDEVMTSSQSDETAQHFFRKLGYYEIGSFDFPRQVNELLFLKTISGQKPNKTLDSTREAAPPSRIS